PHVARGTLLATRRGGRHAVFRPHAAARATHRSRSAARDSRRAAASVPLVSATRRPRSGWACMERERDAACCRDTGTATSCVGASHYRIVGMAPPRPLLGRTRQRAHPCTGTQLLLSHRTAHVVGGTQAPPRAR